MSTTTPYWKSFFSAHVFKIRWTCHIIFISTKRFVTFTIFTPRPPETTRNLCLTTWSFWCSPNVPTFRTTLIQTTLFIVRLLIVSSPICSYLVISWLINQKQLFPIIDLNSHNIEIGLKNVCFWYERNTIYDETMMHSSSPWAP